MKQLFSSRRKFAPVLLMLGAAAVIVGFTLTDSDYFFKVNKSIDIFGRVYKEIALNYVDEVDPEKFMESGIDGLLGTLDPYTNFINEHEGDDVELITTGKYGGIGVTIGQRDGFITILTLMDGYSAQRQGIQPGDRILEIDGKSLAGMKPDGVRSLTRGEPGTEVRLKIEREGEAKPLEFVLMREEIQLKNISYADFLEEGVAYVHIERFSRSAGDELRLALKDLKLKGTVNCMILDLRDNPGGLLDVAVDVVEKFVPKGSLVVSTRGRKAESEKKYFAAEEPMLADVPLIVLINRNSASASEIVAGAIQDLDRGVILGTRSFGKGLVQTIAPLSYNTQLKITTAKYYTPSGRCIQEIDYLHKNNDGVFTITPDSLRQQFKTLKGRIEYERGGITPDTVVNEPEQSALHKELLRKAMYFRFASRYVGTHKELPASFDESQLVGGFQSYLDEQKFTYQDDGETKVKELADVADKSKYSPTVKELIGHLKTELEKEKSSGMERHKAEVMRALTMEIISRYKGERGRIGASLAGDVQLQTARKLLSDAKEYERRLSVK